MPEPDPGEPGPDRNLTFVAWLLAVTSLWLPWWVVRYTNDAGREYDRVSVNVFEDATPAAHHAPTIVTGLVVAAIVVLLFVRLAGRSWHHEPGSWRRDLGVATGLAALAVVSALAWPQEVPGFWGGRTFELVDAPGAFTETALPGLGWWAMLAALLVLAVAAWQARLRRDQDDS